MPAKSLNEVYDYALSLYGTPYQWGGGHNNALKSHYGLDCSGFVRRLLDYAGQEPKGDHTCDDYYHYFLGNGHFKTSGLGSIAFYGTPDRVVHMGFCLDDKVMINAGGGGSNVNTALIAQRLHAFVKIEPIHLRKNFVCTIMPFYKLPTKA